MLRAPQDLNGQGKTPLRRQTHPDICALGHQSGNNHPLQRRPANILLWIAQICGSS
jgi:hypothetical protein